MLYSYADYEEAYYHGRIYKCKEIGSFLLQKLNTKESKKLIKKLSKIKYDYRLSQKELNYINKILLQVKILLMINF